MKLVYKGLSNVERKKRFDDLMKRIATPERYLGVEYAFRDNDPASTREHKTKLQKAYRERREKEIEASLKTMDASITVCGVLFEKGKPVDLDAVPIGGESTETRTFEKEEEKRFKHAIDARVLHQVK